MTPIFVQISKTRTGVGWGGGGCDLAPSVLSTYGPTSHKISGKTNDPIPRKNIPVIDEQTNQGILGHLSFWPVFGP